MATSKGKIHKKGCYVSQEADQTPHFLKFNKDGTLLAAPYKIALGDVATAATGEYKLAGNKLAFTTKQRFGTVAYDGELTADGKLAFAIESKITGWKGKLTFAYVKDSAKTPRKGK